MAKNESRRERKNVQKNRRMDDKNKLNKVYYWIIGTLFLILLLLVVYIFAKSGDNVDLKDNKDTTSIVQEEEADTQEDPAENQTKDEKTEEDSEEPEEDKEKDEDKEEEEPEEDTEEGDSVNEDAPLDTNHDVNYNSGSADRIAIKEKVMQATGLGNNLVESWVGNNGPGRVTADVYSPDKSNIYRVYLQYGDGEWHVTSYDSLNSVPSN